MSGLSVVRDFGLNIYHRVESAGAMAGDAKKFLIFPFQLFFNSIQSLTTYTRDYTLKDYNGKMLEVPDHAHQTANQNFLDVRDTIASFLGHAFRVLNPNAAVDA